MVGCAYVGVGEWLKTATCQKLAKGIDLWYIKWYYTHELITRKGCYAGIDSH